MRLVIRASSLKREPLSPSIVGEFDERGGTIGRSDSNTMTLPDPERRVSRLHAEVSYVANSFHVRNVGSSNPIIVNGRPVGPGEAVALRHGDRMTIGEYELQIALGQNAGSGAPADRGAKVPVDARTVIGASASEARTNPPRPATAGPFEDLMSSPASSTPADPFAGLASSPASAQADPFADLMSSPASAPAAGPFADLLGAQSAPPTPPRSKPATPSQAPTPASAASRPPDDPFADLGGWAPAPMPDAHEDAPFGDLVGDRRSSPGSLDTAFKLDRPVAGQADPLAAFLTPAATPGSPVSADPFAFLTEGALATPREAVGPAVSDHTPDLQAAYRPPPVRLAAPDVMVDDPRVALPAAPPASTPQRRVAEVADGSSEALWSAFCEGAQVRLSGTRHLTPELMRLIGAVLRNAVEGTVRLSAARTTAKQELHVPVTTIRTKNNNPLKFAPNASAALTQLMQPPVRGFLDAPEAMQDAMSDLLGHALGTMAGTRAAMEGMLQRFEPGQLERQLSPGGVLDALVPMNRRARLWELYLQHYGRIHENAREDFQELFGKAFVKAYEEQVDAVASVRRPSR